MSIELKYSLRMLLKKPLFTLLTVMIVAVGLGLTVYSYSLLSNLVFKPMTLNGEQEVVAIEGEFDHNHLFRMWVDPYHVNLALNKLDITEQHGFYREGTTFIGGQGSPFPALHQAQKVNASYTSWNVFNFAGELPLHGRGFVQDDFFEGAEPVVVLSFNVWQQYFNGDPNVINQELALDSVLGRIVGVMPEGFAFPESAEIWQPLGEQFVAPTQESYNSVLAYAKLKPGVSIDEARAGLEAFNKEVATTIGEDYKYRIGRSGKPGSYLTIKPYKQASITQYYNIFMALLVVVFLILLLACINVSNLLLARVNERIKEVAIRVALGIPRKKLVVQMLWESIVICSLGGLFAILFAAYGIEVTNGMLEQAFAVNNQKPFWWQLSIDGAALAILLLAIVAMVLITGLVPAIKALNSDFNAVLRDGTRGALGKKAATTGKVLVISEIVLSCVVLIMATILLATGYFASQADYGVETESRLTAQLQLPEEGYPIRRDTEFEYQDRYARGQAFNRVKQAIEAMPNVHAVAMMSQLPGRGEGTSHFEIEGRGADIYNENPYSNNELVVRDSWQALGMSIIQGRDFDHRDTLEDQYSIIVNESIARDFFPDGDAVGKRVRRIGRNGPGDDWFTIIGVASDTYHGSAMRSSSASYNTYHPIDNVGGFRQYVAIHYSGSEHVAVEALHQAVAKVDANIGIYHIQSYDNLIAQPMLLVLSISKIFLFCGLIAALLAASGIYAMAANNVMQRTQEIGVRRAVGATDKRIMTMFLKQAAWQLSFGLTFGVVLSILLANYMSNTIIINPESYGIALFGIPSMIAVIVMLATYIPTSSVLRMEPSDALHYD